MSKKTVHRRIIVPDHSGLVSRRKALGLGATAAGALAFGWPAEPASANVWALAARAAFAAAVGWLVERLLDRAFPRDPELLAVRVAPSPQPSPDAFHNRWAEPLIIENPQYRISSAYSDRGGCYVGVGPHIRAGRADGTLAYGDLNTPELERCRDEFQGMLIPAGKRQPLSPSDGRLTTVCRKYDRTPDEFRVDYIRPFILAGAVPMNSPIQAQAHRQSQAYGKGRVPLILGYGLTDRDGGRRWLLVDAAG